MQASREGRARQIQKDLRLLQKLKFVGTFARLRTVLFGSFRPTDPSAKISVPLTFALARSIVSRSRARCGARRRERGERESKRGLRGQKSRVDTERQVENESSLSREREIAAQRGKSGRSQEEKVARKRVPCLGSEQGWGPEKAHSIVVPKISKQNLTRNERF